MRKIKQILLLLLIMIMIGVSGCMNDNKDFQTPVLNYLNEKYGCEFTVKTAMESAKDGHYVYMTCEGSVFEGEVFKVECYAADGKMTGDTILVDGEEYYIYDRYADIVFAKQMENELQQAIEENVFVRCEVLINHSEQNPFTVTKAQFAQGMNYCFNQSDLYSYVSVYVLTGPGVEVDNVKTAVESYAVANNAHSQYVSVAVVPAVDEAMLSSHYEENKGSFGAHMNACELVVYMESAQLERNSGITGWTVEKG